MFLEAQPRRTRLEEWVETPRFPEKNISSSDTFRFQTTTPMLREATERLEIKSAAPTCNQMSKTERRLLDRTPLARGRNSKQRFGLACKENGILHLIPVNSFNTIAIIKEKCLALSRVD